MSIKRLNIIRPYILYKNNVNTINSKYHFCGILDYVMLLLHKLHHAFRNMLQNYHTSENYCVIKSYLSTFNCNLVTLNSNIL